jgi:hypothetical protein
MPVGLLSVLAFDGPILLKLPGKRKVQKAAAAGEHRVEAGKRLDMPVSFQMNAT